MRPGPTIAIRRAAQLEPEPAAWLERLPGAVAHRLRGGGKVPRRGEQQRHREVGRRIGQHVRCHADRDAARGDRGEVDVVAADGVVGDRPQARGGVEHGAVDALGEHRQQALGLGDAGEQLLARRRQVTGVHGDLMAGGAQALDRVAGDRAGDEDPGHAAGPYAQRRTGGGAGCCDPRRWWPRG